jgi:hypothetical protein
MTKTPHVAILLSSARRAIELMHSDCLDSSEAWHKALNAALDTGSFIRFECSTGAGGRLLGARLVLIDKSGAQAEIARVE